MLIGELLKVCNDALRNPCMDLSREVRDQHMEIYAYIDTFGHGRIYTPTRSVVDMSTFLSREDFRKKSLKDGSKDGF